MLEKETAEVCLAIVTRKSAQGRLYLVSYRIDPTKPLFGSLQPPGGRRRPDETREQTARRELTEETGIVAPTNARFVPFPDAPYHDIYLAPGTDFYPFFWKVTGKIPRALVTERTEVGGPKNTQWEWWTRHEIQGCHFPSGVGVGIFMLGLDGMATRLGI